MSRKDALLPSFFRKGRESMKKKYVSAMVLTALLGAQLCAGQVQAADVLGGTVSGILAQDAENPTNLTEKVEFDNAEGTQSYAYGALATKGATLNAEGENISVSVSGDKSWNTAVGAETLSSGDNGGIVHLGKAGVTQDINISATAKADYTYAVGLSAITGNTSGTTKASSMTVEGENLNINVSHTGTSAYTGAAGIWVQNNTTADTDGDYSTVNINTENTYISSTAEGASSSGLYVISQGRLNVNSNLEVHADDAIVARGGAVVNVNTDGQHSTKLYGNVDFAYDQETSGTPIDATVNMNLTGADSVWEGNIRASWSSSSPTGPSSPTSDVTGLHLTLSDGAQWNATAVKGYVEEYEKTTEGGEKITVYDGAKYEGADEVTLNGGIINITGAKEQTAEGATAVHTGLTIEKLSGTGGTVNLEADDQFKTRELSILSADGNGEKPTQLAVNFTGINADDISTDKTKQQEQLNALADNVKFGTGIDEGQMTATANVGEGLITGAISAGMATNNAASGSSIVEGSIHQNSSTTTMENMKNIAAVSIAAWRQEDSTLSQRLGDLRETAGGQGIWARVSRGEFEYSGEFKNQYNYFQIGWDMAKNDWHYGAAVSYNDGETTYSDGNGENSSTSLSLYGTRLLNDGQYFDIVLKAGRLNNKYDNYAAAGHTHGDYDAWGTEISGEYGKKIDLANDWFVTPQAQLSLMRIGSEDYTTSNGIHVDQDTLYSAVGRIGAEAGKKTAWGSLYAKASVLHDFAGDADTYTYLTYQGRSNSYSQDIGDTWYEAGFGANWKMSDSSYFYVDVIRTFGGDIKTPWQWNAGVRWGF